MVKKRAEKKSSEKKPPPDGDRAAAQASLPHGEHRDAAENCRVRECALNDGLRRYRDEIRRLQAEVVAEEFR